MGERGPPLSVADKAGNHPLRHCAVTRWRGDGTNASSPPDNAGSRCDRSGTQPFPWIAIQDLCRAMEFIISHEEASGVFNLVAPQQVSQYAFTQAMAARYHAWMKVVVPRWFFRMRYGEAASFLASGQNVRPTRLLEAGFRFVKSTIEDFFESTDHAAVDRLDLHRYMGTWYEIARFDHRFERGLSEVTATYTLMPDGTVVWRTGDVSIRNPMMFVRQRKDVLRYPIRLNRVN